MLLAKNKKYYLIRINDKTSKLIVNVFQGIHVICSDNKRHFYGPNISQLRDNITNNNFFMGLPTSSKLIEREFRYLKNSLDKELNEEEYLELFESYIVNSGYKILIKSDELITPEYIKNHNPELLL